MPGRSEFKVKLNRRDIAEICERAKNYQFRLDGDELSFMKSAPYEDLETLAFLRALEDLLKDRRCEPDFQVDLSE